MNTALRELDARHRDGRPLRVGIIGLGSFGRMALTQLGRIPGVRVVAIADGDRRTATEAVRCAQVENPGLITDEVDILLETEPDVVVEATGRPIAGVAHAVAAIEHGCHVVMANSAADALAGPELARRARAAGRVYTLARGDRPALICDLVTWARVNGFDVVAAGRESLHRSGHHQRNPDTVWELFDHSQEQIRGRGYTVRAVTSLVDGTQVAMELASVANACGLVPQARGLVHPPCGADRLAELLVPRSDGGILEHSGTVEAVSALRRDGHPDTNDLRLGVFVTIAASNDYVARTFRDHGLATDRSGRFAAVRRRVNLLGLEAPASVIAAGLLDEDTGSPERFVAEVAAVAKQDLAAGQMLDGIGGFTAYGRLMPAGQASERSALPIGLAEGCRLLHPVRAGTTITCHDVDAGTLPSAAVTLRQDRTGASQERERIAIGDLEMQSVHTGGGAPDSAGIEREPEVDTDSVWEAVDPEIPVPGQETRRPFSTWGPGRSASICDRVALSSEDGGSRRIPRGIVGAGAIAAGVVGPGETVPAGRVSDGSSPSAITVTDSTPRRASEAGPSVTTNGTGTRAAADDDPDVVAATRSDTARTSDPEATTSMMW